LRAPCAPQGTLIFKQFESLEISSQFAMFLGWGYDGSPNGSVAASVESPEAFHLDGLANPTRTIPGFNGGGLLRPFGPGENSRTRYNEKLTIKVAGLTEQFRTVYGREPFESEMMLIRDAAENALKKRRTFSDHNTVDRLLRRLFKPAPRESRPPAASAKTAGRHMMFDKAETS
jgi:hypothetical protein